MAFSPLREVREQCLGGEVLVALDLALAGLVNELKFIEVLLWSGCVDRKLDMLTGLNGNLDLRASIANIKAEVLNSLE